MYRMSPILLTLVLMCVVGCASTKLPAPAEDSFLSASHPLVSWGKRSGEGYFSSDGNQMVFQSEGESENPFYQIYLRNLQSGETTRVSPGRGKTTCAWIHPDGSTVLFASTHEDPEIARKERAEFKRRASKSHRRYSWDFDENFDLYARDLDSDRILNLTNTKGYDAEGSYSPDGTKIVFGSNRQAYQRVLSANERDLLAKDPGYFMELYIMNADGSGVKRLTEAPGYDGGPFFSPDGESIVWRRFSEDGRKAEVFTMNLDGTGVRQLTELDVLSWAPYFHPSGDYIIFASNLLGHRNFELFLVDARGEHDPVRVTYTDGFDGLPVFHPNGESLAWATTRTPTHASQIYQAKWNDEAARAALGLR